MIQTLQTFIRYRAIDQLLSDRGSSNIEELVNHCIEITGDDNITPDIVKKDLVDMQKSDPPGYHAPLKFDPEKGEYSYSHSDYSLNKLLLNAQETELLRQSVQYLSQLKDHENLKGLKGMIQKITDTLSIQDLSGQSSALDFVQSEIPHSFGGSKFLKPIIKAIQSKQVLRIYYQPFYEDKPYFTLVHPYLLKEYRNRWYLIGLNDIKQELRTYGLDRIWEIHEADQKYIPKSFSSKQYFRNTIGVISPLGEPPEIRISVLRHQANYLITQPLHESQFIESENDENVIFSYKVHPTYEFKSQILAMGADVRVLSPETLKKDILRQLNDAILEYGKTDP